jgi:hypothetical protein
MSTYPSKIKRAITNPESSIPADLIQAYTRTIYDVDGPSPFSLLLGRPSTELKHLYTTFRCDCAIYLTAWNPKSQLLSEAENQSRQKELETEIQILQLPIVPGFGRDPVGEWPPEANVLILGLSLEIGMSLGRKYDQNALVWCAADTIPNLILLR